MDVNHRVRFATDGRYLPNVNDTLGNALTGGEQTAIPGAYMLRVDPS